MINWMSLRAALDVSSPLARALHKVFVEIPLSDESLARDPKRRSELIGRIASVKAAAVSGSLALPSGPAGLLTIVPDLYLLWKLQGQMVSDIAAAYGKTAYLTREGMIYCVFKHGAAQLVRDLAVRTGQQLLVRRASAELLRQLLQRLGIHLSERLAARIASRWVPIVGSVGVGAFAFRDTSRIARTAVEMFEGNVSVEERGLIALN